MRTKTKDPIVQKVIDKMARRSEIGIIKYGNTMKSSKKSLNDWIDSAIEEALDLAVYLEKVKSLVGAKVEQHIDIVKDLGGGGGNYDFDKWEGTDPD